MFKKVKSILALSIAAALCAVSIPSVMAAEPSTDEYGQPIVINGTYDAPAQASITKILQMPVGTNVPEAAFCFDVTKISVDGVVCDPYDPLVPDLNHDALTVEFGFFYGNGASTPDSNDPNVINYVKETGNIFDGVDWPHSGVYVYQITEATDTYVLVAANGNDPVPCVPGQPNVFVGPHESMVYSAAQYTVSAYVKDDPQHGYYVAAVTSHCDKDDNGDDTDYKVDPTPGVDNGFSDMSFTNQYTHTNGPSDPADPDFSSEYPPASTLSVSKAVTGSMGDKNQYFGFTMSILPPSLVVDVPVYYRAYVVEGSTVVTSEDNADPSLIGSDNGGSFIKFVPSMDTPFNLKDGQQLVFIDTTVGTQYSVSEDDPGNYTASLVITSDNSAAPAIGDGNIGEPVQADDQFVGEALNKAEFTNNRDMMAPTGLKISDLPFIGLIALALASLTVFVVAKSRRKKAYNR